MTISPPTTEKYWRAREDLPQRLPELLSLVPHSFRVGDFVGTLRDGERVSFGPEGTCEPNPGETLRVILRPEAYVSPQSHDWAFSWNFALPVHGWEGSVVRTPVGRWSRRLRRALSADSTGCPRFDDSFACIPPKGISRAQWIGRELAERLADATSAMVFKGANLINVSARAGSSIVVHGLMVPTAEAVLETYQLAQTLRSRWAPTGSALRPGAEGSG